VQIAGAIIHGADRLEKTPPSIIYLKTIELSVTKKGA
jgi:hypothetical protein